MEYFITKLRNNIFALQKTGDIDAVNEALDTVIDKYLHIIQHNINQFKSHIDQFQSSTNEIFKLNSPDLLGSYPYKQWLENFYHTLRPWDGNPFISNECIEFWLYNLQGEYNDLINNLQNWRDNTSLILANEFRVYGKILRPRQRVNTFSNYFSRIIHQYPFLEAISYSRSHSPKHRSKTPPASPIKSPGSPQTPKTGPTITFTPEKLSFHNIGGMISRINSLCPNGVQFTNNWQYFKANEARFYKERDDYYQWLQRPRSPPRRPRSPPRRPRSPPRRPRSPPRRPRSPPKQKILNCYDILQVHSNATQKDISKQYKKLSIKHHPDKGGNPEVFALISSAYDVVGDPSKRIQYDRDIQQEREMSCTSY